MKKKVALITLCLFLVGLLAGPLSANINATGDNNAVRLQDINDDWARQDIEAVVAKGFIKGYEDNTYRPNQSVTCLEVIVMLIRAANLEDQVENYTLSSDRALALSQIPDWGKAYAAVAVEAGILSSNDISTFKPQQEAMRYQVCLYMQNALKLCGLQDQDADRNNLTSFTDNDLIPPQARSAVSLMSQYGVVNGYPDGSFGPNRVVKRNEMAKMLNNFHINCLQNIQEPEEEGEKELILTGILENKYFNSVEETLTLDVIDESGYRWRFSIAAGDDVDVYYEGSKMRLNSDLTRIIKTGGPAFVLLNEEQEAVWVKIYEAVADGQTILAGTLEEIKYDNEKNSLSLDVIDENGSERAFDLERRSGIKVYYNNRFVVFNEDLDTIIPGGLITVVLDEEENPVLLRIYVPDGMEGYEVLVGSLDKISYVGNNLNIRLTDNDEDEWSFVIDQSDSVDIYYDGTSMELSKDINNIEADQDIKILMDENEKPVWVRIYSAD